MAYLNWRYAAHPVFKYHLFECRRDGVLRGVAVYRIEIAKGIGIPIGRIVELIADHDSQIDLLTAISRHAEDQRVAVLDFFCTSPAVRNALLESGFTTGENVPFPVLFQPVDQKRAGIPFMAFLKNLPTSMPAPECWYVTKSDGDQDRPN
jgi:hypothetical protein